MPTLTPSAPASISIFVASPVATLPAISCTCGCRFLVARTASITATLMTVRGVDHEHVDAGLDQRVAARLAIRAWPDRGANAQAAALVFNGQRIALGLQQILDRDEPDELTVVDDQQLFDAMFEQELAGRIRRCSRARRRPARSSSAR